MKALITGFTGFVGSHLTDYLLNRTDWEVYGMMRWADPLDNLEGLTRRINQHDRIHILYADLNDPFSLHSAIESVRPDYIFHLAAQSFPKTSYSIPAETLMTNAVGTLNLLEAVLRVNSKIWIHVCSSSEVYGKVPMELCPIKEDCPFNPASPYAISKASADMLARFYAKAYKMNIITTRMFTHTGSRRGDVFAESSFAKQIAMIEAKMMDPPLKVGNLASVRTVADVRDAVRAYHMALTVNPISGEVYNIGGTYTCTVNEILGALFEAAEMTCDIEVDPERLRPVDADNQIPDCSKFKEHTGWEPEISFEQTINSLLDYWRWKVKRGVPLQR